MSLFLLCTKCINLCCWALDGEHFQLRWPNWGLTSELVSELIDEAVDDRGCKDPSIPTQNPSLYFVIFISITLWRAAFWAASWIKRWRVALQGRWNRWRNRWQFGPVEKLPLMAAGAGSGFYLMFQVVASSYFTELLDVPWNKTAKRW